jgi:hypothetical protein
MSLKVIASVAKVSRNRYATVLQSLPVAMLMISSRLAGVGFLFLSLVNRDFSTRKTKLNNKLVPD